jgi:hypothetical protein
MYVLVGEDLLQTHRKRDADVRVICPEVASQPWTHGRKQHPPMPLCQDG